MNFYGNKFDKNPELKELLQFSNTESELVAALILQGLLANPAIINGFNLSKQTDKAVKGKPSSLCAIAALFAFCLMEEIDPTDP